uniref:Uncharacterized protein n=1 Tax=viral metagenome TaxID=1070528 RepID=A0A6C0AJI4_9ZZZZ
MEGGRSAWLKAVMAAKKPGMSLGDAMKAAKKTYKKSKTGGTLMEKMGPMGGRRRRGTRKAKVGGTAYGFTGGPYTDSQLTDGAGRFPALPDATWKGPSELLGGRRSRRSKKAGRRHRKVGGDGSQLAPVGEKPADLPYASPSVAPESHQSSGPVGPADEGAKSGPAGVGGRRRRHSKKAGKRRHH